MIGVLRTIFMALDVAVYWCVEVLLQLIMDLANVEIFANSVIDEFSSRIYLILGLVMLFKLMLSFIQLLINPDTSGKENGVGNILKRVVISLALIFLVPSIFDLARMVQVEVIPVIPKVVLGVSFDESDTNNADEESGNSVEGVMESASRLMAFYAYRPFFTYQNEICHDGSILGTSTDGEVYIWSVQTAFQNRHTEDVCSTDPDGYKYSYTFLIPTIVGAYLVYVLVTIAVEVAIRAIKLGMCELLAPIPISSYVDPKSSKKTFDKWVSISIKTYLDLFIRLILIYFVIFIFVTVFSEENLGVILTNVGEDFGRQGLVIVFIIVGLLQFIKQAPKFFSDMLGLSNAGNLMGMLKGDGFKAFGEAAGIPGTAAAAVGAGIQNTRNSWKNSRGAEPGAKWWMKAASAANALRRGVGGAVGATRRGLAATYRGEGLQGAYHRNLRETVDRTMAQIQEERAAREVNNELRNTVNRASNDVNEHRDNAQKLRNQMGDNYEADLNNANTNLNNDRTTLSQATARRERADSNLRTAERMMQNEVNDYHEASKKYNAFKSYHDAVSSRNNLASYRDRIKSQYDLEMSKPPANRDQAKLKNLQQAYLSAEKNVQTADDKVLALQNLYGSTYDFTENFSDVQNAWRTSEQNLKDVKERLRVDILAQEFNQAKEAEKQSEAAVKQSQEELNRLEKLKVDYDLEIKAIEKAEKDLKEAKATQRKDRIIPVVTDIKMGVAEFRGDSIPKGKDYIDLASHLESQKKSILQGEAFKKIEENLSLVISKLGEKDDAGNHTGRFTYKTKSGGSITESFDKMLEARQLFATGAERVEIGGKEVTAPEFNEYFKDAQKTVGEAYVNAVIAGQIDNETVKQARIREIQAINAMNIPNELKEQYTREINENFGGYLKRATDVAERWRTKGETMRGYERAVEEKK